LPEILALRVCAQRRAPHWKLSLYPNHARAEDAISFPPSNLATKTFKLLDALARKKPKRFRDGACLQSLFSPRQEADLYSIGYGRTENTIWLCLNKHLRFGMHIPRPIRDVSNLQISRLFCAISERVQSCNLAMMRAQRVHTRIAFTSYLDT